MAPLPDRAPLPGAAPIGVALLGSTGSIGTQTLGVVDAIPGRFRVVALAAGRDLSEFQRQLDRYRPRFASIADPGTGDRLTIPDGTSLDRAPDALERLATEPDVDLVVVATGGMVSLRPVLAALRAGKVVATANKETLVAGGHLVMPIAAARATEVAARDERDPMADPLAWLRPIDSEHSAIWQCLVGERRDEVARLILTASGGPFRSWDAVRLEGATPREALDHPNWAMGDKVTVDSATLMNKGLEVIEARWLYDVTYERIDVLVHPQSLIHSLVEFVDGSLKAQLGQPTMTLPIQYALTWPRRVQGDGPRLTLDRQATMTFEAPDEARFPALAVARAAGIAGPRASAALISADEVAVRRFLAGELSFPGITHLVADAVERFGAGPDPDVEALEALDAEIWAWGSAVVREGRA